MAIKFTTEGLLIYAAMLAYALAAAALVLKDRKLGMGLYLVGFAAAAMAFGMRWCIVKHVPLRNMFEVLLFLGVVICPLSLFCRRYLRVEAFAADCVIGVIALFPAGFVFGAEAERLRPALQTPLFGPHVATYMVAYALMAKASVQAAMVLAGKQPDDERLIGYELGTYKMVRLGFPLLTLGLVLGAWWGKIAWGDYWNWDSKELWSLISWLVYVGYLHFRYRYGARRPRANSWMVLAGMAAIILTLLWVNLARIFKGGLHSYAS